MLSKVYATFRVASHLNPSGLTSLPAVSSAGFELRLDVLPSSCVVLHMMASFRRLAKDHATLRASLPPNYLFPPTDDPDALPDDLTQLSIHLTGSEGTPYSSGVWLLHLRIPPDYPKSPPKATFKTRIFHPNVEESSGAVCLETLKRDWDPKLTLKDILVTISCLLIQPNPDSALNAKAGVLVREDYDGFVRQARLMTRIHAPIPAGLKEEVERARSRGEEQSVDAGSSRTQNKMSASTPLQKPKDETAKSTMLEVSNSDEGTDSAKENKPSLRTTKAQNDASELKRYVQGKRPLTDLGVVAESEDNTMLPPIQALLQCEDGQPPRKSPKHTHNSQANGRKAIPAAPHESNEQVVMPQMQDETSSTASITTSSRSTSQTLPLPSKYRTYARVGVKRL